MRILDIVRLRLRSLFRRADADVELEAELHFHQEQLIEENIASGMAPEDARRAAQRTIGAMAQYNRRKLGRAGGRVAPLAPPERSPATRRPQGVAIGLAGALALNRLISSLLFGVQPTDTVTIAAVIATITAVAMVASWLPAWRASRLDPNLVLRDE